MPGLNKLLCTVAAFAAFTLLSASTARADVITFTTFGDFQSAANAAGIVELENVLSQGDASGMVVTGITNQTATLVRVASPDGLTVSESNGQARFAASGASFDQFTISLESGGTFRALAFNLNELNGQCSQQSPCTLMFSIAGSVNPGEETQSFVYTGGSGFLAFLAVDGQHFTSVSLIAEGIDLEDISQVRIGGFEQEQVIPEPMTMVLFGTGLAGVGAAARRRRQSRKG